MVIDLEDEILAPEEKKWTWIESWASQKMQEQFSDDFC